MKRQKYASMLLVVLILFSLFASPLQLIANSDTESVTVNETEPEIIEEKEALIWGLDVALVADDSRYIESTENKLMLDLDQLLINGLNWDQPALGHVEFNVPSDVKEITITRGDQETTYAIEESSLQLNLNDFFQTASLTNLDDLLTFINMERLTHTVTLSTETDTYNYETDTYNYTIELSQSELLKPVSLSEGFATWIKSQYMINRAILTQYDLKQVSFVNLNEANPTFDDLSKLNQLYDVTISSALPSYVDQLKDLTQVKSITLSQLDIDSVAFLEDMVQLEQLYLSGVTGYDTPDSDIAKTLQILKDRGVEVNAYPYTGDYTYTFNIETTDTEAIIAASYSFPYQTYTFLVDGEVVKEGTGTIEPFTIDGLEPAREYSIELRTDEGTEFSSNYHTYFTTKYSESQLVTPNIAVTDINGKDLSDVEVRLSLQNSNRYGSFYGNITNGQLDLYEDKIPVGDYQLNLYIYGYELSAYVDTITVSDGEPITIEMDKSQLTNIKDHGIKVSSEAENSLTITWPEYQAGTSISLYVSSMDNGQSFELDATKNEYTITDLKENQLYDFQVAINYGSRNKVYEFNYIKDEGQGEIIANNDPEMLEIFRGLTGVYHRDITLEDLKRVTESHLYLSGRNIYDLTGIEYLENLTYLDISKTPLAYTTDEKQLAIMKQLTENDVYIYSGHADWLGIDYNIINQRGTEVTLELYSYDIDETKTYDLVRNNEIIDSLTFSQDETINYTVSDLEPLTEYAFQLVENYGDYNEKSMHITFKTYYADDALIYPTIDLIDENQSNLDYDFKYLLTGTSETNQDFESQGSVDYGLNRLEEKGIPYGMYELIVSNYEGTIVEKHTLAFDLEDVSSHVKIIEIDTSNPLPALSTTVSQTTNDTIELKVKHHDFISDIDVYANGEDMSKDYTFDVSDNGETVIVLDRLYTDTRYNLYIRYVYENLEIKENTLVVRTEGGDASSPVINTDADTEKYLREITGVYHREIRESDLADITDVTIYNKSYDLLFLEKMPDLRSLNLYNAYPYDDLLMIKSLVGLRDLTITNSILSDISLIDELVNLEYLRINDAEVSNITSINQLSNLYTVDFDYNNITDITVLESLPGLERIYLSGNPIEDVTPLLAIDSLENLSMYEVIINDYTVMNELRERGVNVNFNYYYENDENPYVWLSNIRVKEDTIFIEWEKETLDYDIVKFELYFDDKLIELPQDATSYTFTDLEPETEYNVHIIMELSNGHVLEEWEYIETMYELGDVISFKDESLRQALIDNIYPTMDEVYSNVLERQEYLWLSHADIIDILELSQAKNLVELSLYSNNITDISPLASLTQLSYLDLDGNPISDISALAEIKSLETLYLSHTEVTDLQPLLLLPNLKWVSLYEVNINFDSPENQEILEALELKGVNVWYSQRNPDIVVDGLFTFNKIADTFINFFINDDIHALVNFEVYLDGDYVGTFDNNDWDFGGFVIDDLTPETTYNLDVEVYDAQVNEYVTTYSTTFTTESSDNEDDVDDDEDAPVVETKAVSLQLFDEDQNIVTHRMEFYLVNDETEDYYYGYVDSEGYLKTYGSSKQELPLVKGDYTVTVFGVGPYEDTISTFTVSEETEEVAITIESTDINMTDVVVSIVDADGEPVTSVDRLSLFSYGVATTHNYRHGDYELAEAKANDGQYIIKDVVVTDQFNYRLMVEDTDYLSYSQSLTVTSDIDTQEVMLDQGYEVTGRTVNSQGQSLAGVSYSIESGKYWNYGETEDVAFTITRLPKDDVALRFSMTGYQDRVVTINKSDFVDGAYDLGDIELQKEQYIEGKVLLEDGTEASNVTVYLYKANGRYIERSTQTSDTGEFRFNNISDGNYRLVFESYQHPRLEVKNITPADEKATYILEEEKSGALSGEGNTFAANKRQVVSGETFTYRYNYQNNGEASVSDATLTLQLDEHVTLIEESFLFDDETITYEDGVITLQDVEPGTSGVISFQVTVNDEATDTLVSTINVKADDETYNKTATTNVLSISLEAPAQTKTKDFSVYGQAKTGTTVEVYEGERFLAETVVEGKWWYATIELPGDIGEAKDYQLTAKVIDGDQESRTAPVKVSYRPDMVSMTDAHVTAGWNRDMTINEKTGVIATAIAEFTPIEVSVTFDGEVEEAFIHFIGQTVSLTKEDNQFVGTFPSGWTSFGEQLFEVSYIVNGETIRVPLMEVLVLIDPSGYVFEGSMENRLEGATAILEVWLEDEERWAFYDTTLINQINPQTTDVDGRYGWDVPKGDWRVVFSKDDYARYESRRVVVPPAETELNVPLTRTTDPVVDTIDFGTLETNPHDASIITITFDRLMDVASLKEAIELKLGEQSLAIDYDYHSLPGYKEVEGQSGYYETDESIELTDEITIQLKEDSFTPGETYDVVISTLASDYDGKTLTEYVYDSVTIQDDEVIDPENPGDDNESDEEADADDMIEAVEKDGTLTVDLSKSESTDARFTAEQIQKLKDKNATVMLKKAGVEVSIPVSNLSGDVVISVSERDQEGVTHYEDAISYVYDFTVTADGKYVSTFTAPVNLTFGVLDQVDDIETLGVYYWNPDALEWEYVGGNYKDGVITTEVNHFSTYAVFSSLTFDNVNEGESDGDDTIDTPTENPGDDTNQTPESGTDSEDAGSEEQLPADDDQDGAIDDSNEATGNQDGSSDLPNTSTNTYQLLLMGALFILFGTGSVVLYRKKQA